MLALWANLLLWPFCQAVTNPVLWDDLADLDVFRVDDAWYYSASTMHYSPGAPVLRSYDLANWEYIGHSVPSLSWSSKYSLEDGERAYVQGIWASTLRYRPSNGLWYWIGCIEFSTTYIYTASSPEGPWELSGTLDVCFYDCGLLIDDDDTMYVAYGSTNLQVAQLSSDGLGIVQTQVVFSSPDSIGYLEGSRFYKRDGLYYIFTTHPATQEWTLQSTSPFGNYTAKVLADAVTPPVVGGNPHQGSLVDTPAGDWYYMAFIDNYPGGRIPVLAPITWGDDGFPTLTLSDGAWPTVVSSIADSTADTDSSLNDTFAGSALEVQWEWNHNPDESAYTIADGLTLRTATVTGDLYQARNTLTRRIRGPKSVATISMDVSNMLSGDRAGLALFRDQSAWIGVLKDGDALSIGVTTGINMNSDWTTNSTGSVVATNSTSSTQIWLQITADIASGGTNEASFAYSTDGVTFIDFGPVFTMNTAWEFFMGYRWGIFNYATSTLGGSVRVSSFGQDVLL